MNIRHARWPRIALLAVLIAGTAVRLDVAQHGVVFRGDQNIVPLMALHISRGEDLPLYFYGQHYMGAFGAYLMAGVFTLAGPSDFAVSSTMALFSLLWMVALYLLFGRLINPWAGVVAAAIAAFGSPGLVWRSVEPWIGYISTFAFGTLILYCGVRLNDHDRSTRTEWACVLGMAALAGQSIWANPICLPYLMVGCALLVAYVIRSRLDGARVARLALGLLVFLVAVSPVIVTGIRYGFNALFGFRAPSMSYVPDVVSMTFTQYLPELFDANPDGPLALRVVIPVAYALPVLALFVGFVAGVLRRDRRLVRAAFVPVLFTIAFLPFFLTSSLAKEHNPRYFLMFYLLIAGSFAYPLAFRRRWITASCVTLAALVALSNTVACLRAGHGENGQRIEQQRDAHRAVVAQAEALGLRHVMCDAPLSYVFNWASRDRVIFADPWNERYYPYLAGAIADDAAGFCLLREQARVFENTLTAIGVTAESSPVGAWVFFHDLALPTNQWRLVSPAAASLVRPGAEPVEARGFIDADEETMPGERYDADAELVIDLGDVTRVAGMRFVAPYEWDYPAGYSISGSSDGSEWIELQRIARRDAMACLYGDRLFHRGHDAVMECRFSSPPVRFIKVHGMRAPAEHCPVWRFSEISVYADNAEGHRPDQDEADEIIAMLRESGVDFAVCDPWLSARIGAGTTAGAFPCYSPRHRHTHVSRVVPIRKSVAVVVEHAHAEQARQLIEDAVIGETLITMSNTRNYTLLLIVGVSAGYDTYPHLKWNGFTLVRTARIATAAWHHERGVEHERARRTDRALACFEHSFNVFEGLPANLEKLAPRNDRARRALDRLTPEIEARVEFPHGMTLRGYTVEPSELVAGTDATLRLVWELEGEIPYDYLPLFIHFSHGDTIRFQADHNATFPLRPRTTVPRCLVLDEHTFTVPADCPPGALTIELGALTWWDSTRRLRVRSALRQRDGAVEIGTAAVVREVP